MQSPPVARLQPRDLQCMRTREQDDLLPFAVGTVFCSHPNEELVASAFSLVLAAVESEIKFAHVIGKRGRRCDLGHGAMKRPVPACVILDVTRSTRA